jgi:hypothetical protein
MKTLSVCGDSWFTSDMCHPGKSLGEIVSERLGWKFVSLARCGSSNFAISLQVDKAIEIESDFIIIGATTPDRIEIPIINKNNQEIWDRLKNFFNWNDWSYNQPETYRKKHGISNVQHSNRNDLSSHNPWIGEATMISNSLANLVFTPPDSVNTEQVSALKSYMLTLYDSGIKRQIDCWIMSDACRRLIASGIPFLFFIEPLYDPGDHYQEGFRSDIGWVDNKNLINPGEFSYYLLPKDEPGSFHYDVNRGGIIFADFVQKKMENLL